MTHDDLSFLAAHVATIDGQRPTRIDEVQGRIRTASRRRAAGTVGGVALVAAAAVVAITLFGSKTGEHSEPPVNQPTVPTVSPINEPASQTEVAADFAPSDVVHDLEEFASATSEPGATELHESLPFGETYYPMIAGYCRASADIWWVANGTYGQCSPDAELKPTPPAEFQPIGNAPMELQPPGSNLDQETAVDMWLTGPLTEEARDCVVEAPSFTGIDTEPCIGTGSGVTRITDGGGAEFGIAVYRHRAPTVVDVLGDGFEAAATFNGDEYLFSRAVFSASGQDQLAEYLEVSDQPRILLVAQENPQRTATLLIDGDEPAFPTDLAPGSAWRFGRQEVIIHALVPPGSHNVTVDIRGNARVAVLIYEATPEG